MTETQEATFERNGFLIVPAALSAAIVDQLINVTERLCNAELTTSGRWDRRNCVVADQVFMEVLTQSDMLALVVSLLGWNIKLLTSDLVRLAPSSETTGLAVQWHHDGGAIGRELPEPLPPLFVKVGYCLSGSDQPNSGQLRVVPGSHRLIGKPAQAEATSDPYGWIELSVQPGDAVIFDWRLWHAVSPNQSQTVRRNLYFGLGPRWLMPMDYLAMPDEILAGASPIGRQLLGVAATAMGHYLPTSKDLPLRTWWQEYQIQQERG